MPQQSLSEFVNDMEKAGMLVRIKEEKRVDELPGIMEANPLKAVLVEKVKIASFNLVSKDPDTGIYDWGIYRSMFCGGKNEKSFDVTCSSHRQRLHALAEIVSEKHNLTLSLEIQPDGDFISTGFE